MRFCGLPLALLASAISTAWCWDHMNGNTLETTLKDTKDLALVAFVASSEPKSQALEKEWLSAVSRSKKALLSIDCEAESAVCAKHEISYYPTLQLFENGSLVERYLGPRRASGILSFLSRLARPIITELNLKNLEEFRTIDETVFIGYVSSGDDAARQSFAEIAEKYRNEFTFGMVSDESVIKGQNLASPTVVCHIADYEETRSLNSFAEAGVLDNFVLEASRRVIGELMLYNQQRLLDRGWPMVYVFGETEDDRAKLRADLQNFAKSYYDSLTCVTVDPLEFPDLQAAMGLEPGVFPSGVVHQLSRDRRYPYPRNLPVDSRSLQKWGLDVWQGRIKPWTPPGVTTAYDDMGPIKAATRKLSIANIPGVNIRVGGRDEL